VRELEISIPVKCLAARRGLMPILTLKIPMGYFWKSITTEKL
jgi:hypothetical protein